MKVYLSGPMTGLPDFGYPAFREHAARLRAQGYTVLDPSENFGGATDRPRSEYMRLDVQHVLDATAIAVLPGWRRSKGAQLEVAIGRELGLPIFDVTTMRLLEEETILEEAQRVVHGDRGADYGHPIEDFSRTAGMWTAAAKHLLRDGAAFGPREVAIFMVLVKVSREVNRPKRDNRTDICGYAETLDMVDARLRQ